MEQLNLNSESEKSSSLASSEPVAGLKKHNESSPGELLRFAIIALIIVLPIKWFIITPFLVSGASMEDTFYHNDYLIVDRVSYRFENPARGDVIIFRYPRDPSKYFIKRVIGLPGETIKIDGSQVIITNTEHPEGLILDEPNAQITRQMGSLTQELGAEEYFVMGDNRDASSDSRVWGTLEESKIIGRALLRLFPLNEVGLFPGSYGTDTTLLLENSS